MLGNTKLCLNNIRVLKKYSEGKEYYMILGKKEKKMFMMDMSHELKTPINIILSTIQLLKKNIDDGNITYNKNINIDFTGNGIVVLGNVNSICSVPTSNYVALLDVYIDGEKVEQVKMPYDYIVRKYDIFHKYLLENKDHRVEIKWINKNPDFSIYMKSIAIYADKPSI